jgi:hypothetical protein
VHGERGSVTRRYTTGNGVSRHPTQYNNGAFFRKTKRKAEHTPSIVLIIQTNTKLTNATMSTTTTSTFCNGSTVTVDVPAGTNNTTAYIKEQIANQTGNHVDTLCLLDPEGAVATARSAATEFAVVICDMPIHRTYEFCVDFWWDIRFQLKLLQDGTEQIFQHNAECKEGGLTTWSPMNLNIVSIDDAPVKTFRLEFEHKYMRMACEYTFEPSVPLVSSSDAALCTTDELIPNMMTRWYPPCTIDLGVSVRKIGRFRIWDEGAPEGRVEFFYPNTPQPSQWAPYP